MKLQSRWVWAVALAAVSAVSSAQAQSSQAGTLPAATVQQGDAYQAQNSKNQRIRMLPSQPALHSVPASVLYRTTVQQPPAPNAASFSQGTVSNQSTLSNQSTVFRGVTVPAIAFSPLDLSFQGGWNGIGSLQTASNFLVFLNYNNCPSCWSTDEINLIGDPVSLLSQYISNLNNSVDVHVTDQYVGSTTNLRYPLGSPSWSVSSGVGSTMTDADAQAAVHAVALANGNKAGPHNIYHLFLPPGQNVCFDGSYTQCYSPNNWATFYFCGYHSSVTFGDVGTVFYSVEPYDYVDGCRGTTQNGTPQDALSAQVSVLGHEIFETITDPYPGYGWVALKENGEEIGDLCAWTLFNHLVGSRTYVTQLEYSNASHACKNQK